MMLGGALRTGAWMVAAGMLLGACAPQPEAPAEAPAMEPPIAQERPAPWNGAPISADGVHSVHFAEWRKAENRSNCALIAFRAPEHGAPATPRAASFAGGWGVAYDLPELRSAFGVAGTGVEADGPNLYDEWPYAVHWGDGSTAGYGPEGGSGTKQLAYLTIAGERCLYNVWSWFGAEHLEHLLEELRWVAAE